MQKLPKQMIICIILKHENRAQLDAQPVSQARSSDLLMFSLEETPLDIAATYGDYYLYGFIKEKWDALPPVKDKRKTRAKKTSARPRSTPASAQVGKITV